MRLYLYSLQKNFVPKTVNYKKKIVRAMAFDCPLFNSIVDGGRLPHMWCISESLPFPQNLISSFTRLEKAFNEECELNTSN
jgi:hypothetical protein